MERVGARIAPRPGAPGEGVRPAAERERDRERHQFERALSGRARTASDDGRPAGSGADAREHGLDLDVGAAPDEEPGAHLDLTA